MNISLEELKSAWIEGLTVTELYVLRLIECGVEITDKDVAEFCGSWGMSKAAFYKARKSLIRRGWICRERVVFVAPPVVLKVRSLSSEK